MMRLAWKSLWNWRSTALLAILAIAMSVTLILSVEKIRQDARASFTQTVSGTDLIVGVRSGARPSHVFALLCIESTLLTVAGLILGLLFHTLVTPVAGQWLSNAYDINVPFAWPESGEGIIMLCVMTLGIAVGLCAAWKAYRK